MGIYYLQIGNITVAVGWWCFGGGMVLGSVCWYRCCMFVLLCTEERVGVGELERKPREG